MADLAEVAERSGEGIVAFDAGWRYRFINGEAERAFGLSRDRLLGRVIWEEFPTAKDGPFYAPFVRCMAERAPAELEQFSAVLGRWFAVRVVPLPGGGVASYFHDVHARREAERQSARDRDRLRLLSRASGLLAESLDYGRVLGRTLEVTVPEVADLAYLLVLPRDGVDPGGTALGEPRALVAHRDPAKAVAARDALRRWPEGAGRRPHPVRLAMESRSPEYALRLAPEVVESMAADPAHLTMLNSLDLRSLVCVPLLARGEVLGAALFARTGDSGRLYAREDVSLLEEVAHRAAMALENAALFAAAGERLAEATRAREEVARLLAEREAAAAAQRAFLRDVLRSLTEGRLCLCDHAGELPETSGETERLALTPPSLRDLRRLCEAAGREAGLPDDRRADLTLAVGEAAMNAVVHAGGGEAEVWADPEAGTVRVRVRDEGAGISEGFLHRATLERGFSTGGTLGHGFSVMTQTCDRLHLLTGPEGTTVVIEQGRDAPDPNDLLLPPGW
jgi:PAS domain S-box-containing protein